jgi:lysophospholipase L1-like esterase
MFNKKLYCGLLLIFSIVFSLILGEIILRVFDINLQIKPSIYPRYLKMYDEALGYKLAKNFKGKMKTSEFSIKIEINQEGWRDYRRNYNEPADYCILVLGDSYTFGHGVEMEESYPKILEKKLNKNADRLFRVINAGMPGAGQEWHYNFLTRFLKRYPPPDLVIDGFFVNDIRERVNDVIIENGWVAERDKKYKIPFEKKLREKSYLYWLFKNIYNRFSMEAKREGYLKCLSSYLVDYPGVLKAQWDYNEQCLEQIYRKLDSLNIPLFLLYIPARIQVQAEHFADISKTAKAPVENYCITKPNDLLGKWAKKKNIHYLDLYNVFKTKGRHCYIPDDHWDRAGHELAAQEIYNSLMRIDTIKNSQNK